MNNNYAILQIVPPNANYYGLPADARVVGREKQYRIVAMDRKTYYIPSECLACDGYSGLYCCQGYASNRRYFN